jgi:hypothetical protein
MIQIWMILIYLLQESLGRIKDIVKKIDKISSEKRNLDFEDYSSYNKMVKLK